MALTEPHLEPSPIEAMVDATRRLGIDRLLGATAIDFFADVAEKLSADNRDDFEAGGFVVQSWPQEELYCPSVATRDRSNRNIFNVHFIPSVFDDKRKPEQIEEPAAKQKANVILQGMYGALAYVTAVEAGLEPKPTALAGITNPTMARFAKRIGFMSVEEYIHNDKIESPIKALIGVDSKSLRTFYKEFDLDNLGQADQETEEALAERFEHISHILKAIYEQGNHAVANAILPLVILAFGEEDVSIFCDYETFKLKTLTFAHKFHHLLTSRAIQEIDLEPAA